MSILDKFPKQRTELPEAYRMIYNTHYLSNREGKYKTTSLSQKLESWMHRKVAGDLKHMESTCSTMEIGAGTLNQLHYEREGLPYDIVEPFRKLFENSPLLSRVQTVYIDIAEIPEGRKYDRITSTATFEHIMDLPFVVASAGMHLNDGGHLRVAIPNEGTVLWTLGTKITGCEFRKRYGLDYRILMQYEHVNTADEVEEVLHYFFGSCRCSVLGLSRGLAFYRFYDCSEPNIQRISDYFEQRRSESGLKGTPLCLDVCDNT
jgi:hypothetical protein